MAIIARVIVRVRVLVSVLSCGSTRMSLGAHVSYYLDGSKVEIQMMST